MTRDELIEAMARALAETDTIRQPHTNGHTYEAARLAEFMHTRCKGVATAVLTAIEAQGMAVVPVEVTKEMVVAGDDTKDECIDEDWDSGNDGESYNTYTIISSDISARIYRAMIAAGRV